jgi:D-tyrosyl-tRNA(Tyr) deacylase
MRAVVQRVNYSKVSVDGQITGEISNGLTVLLGVGQEDTNADIDYLAEKIVNLRIFEDDNGKMNRSLIDIKGQLLIISQFTLYGDCRHGRRPGYDKAARPETAKIMYDAFVEKCKEYGIYTQTGIFQADMLVDIHNQGPVTLLIDSKKEF